MRMETEQLRLEISRTDALIADLLAELHIDARACSFLWQCAHCATINLKNTHQSCFVCHAQQQQPPQVQQPQEQKPQPQQTAVPPSAVVAAPQPQQVQPQQTAVPPSAVVAAPQQQQQRTCSACFSVLTGQETVCAKCLAGEDTTTAQKVMRICAACGTCSKEGLTTCDVCLFEDNANECFACKSVCEHGTCTVCACSSSSTVAEAWRCDACGTLNLDAHECRVCFAERAPAPAQPAHNMAACSACGSVKPPGMCATCLYEDARDACAACGSALTGGECALCGFSLQPQPEALLPVTPTLDLSLDGKRESLTAERAHELLRGGASSGVRKLRLSSKSFGKDASEVAARYIADKMQQVEDADFSDIIAGRPTEEALEVLRVLCASLNPRALRRVDLSDNALGERGIRTLTPFFQSIANTVESISLRNDGLSELSLSLLVDALAKGTGSDGALRIQALHFESNMSGDGGAKALAPLFERMALASRDLPLDFSMVSCRVRSEGSAALNKSLLNVAHRLRRLDLSDCMMGELGSEALVSLLGQAKALEELRLKDTGITKRALARVVDCLRDMHGLRVLDLSVLEMPSSVMAALFRALNDMGDKSVLEELYLGENCANGLGGVSELFIRATACPKLHVVDLSHNELGDDVAGMILGRLGEKRKLKRLELNGNHFSEGVVEVLQFKLPGVIGDLDENE